MRHRYRQSGLHQRVESECPCERASYDSSDANAMSLTLNKENRAGQNKSVSVNQLGCCTESSEGFLQHCSVLRFFSVDLQPMSMRQIVNIFSASVLGETLPKPTDVRPVIVK